MAAVTLSVPELLRHAKGLDSAVAADLIKGAMGRASRIAPCITSADFPQDSVDEVKSIIRDAILRRVDAGSGAVTSETAGPFARTIDTRRPWGRSFSKEEEADLQAICAAYRQVPAEIATSIAHMPASPLDDRRYMAAMYPPPPVRPYGST